MKKFALLIAALAVLASCDKKTVENSFAAITGIYEGYTDANSGMFAHYPTDNEIFAITDNGNGTLNLLFTSQVWGIYDTKGVEPVEAAGTYTINGSGTATITMPNSSRSTEAQYELIATIKSKTDATIVITMPGLMKVGDRGTVVTFYTGAMPDDLK
jgi:hypothetical protein